MKRIGRERTSNAHTTRLVLALTIGAGLVLTAGLTKSAEKRINEEARLRFERADERLVREVRRRITLPEYGLMGARGVFAASQQVERHEFVSYVSTRELPREFPGVRGFGFIKRVERAALNAFIERERADGAPDFTVQTSGDASDLYVITTIEPYVNNAPALGFDIGSEPRRRAAAEKAIETGTATLTAPVILLQDSRRMPGQLLMMPIFKKNVPLDTPEQRNASLVGLVYAALVSAELFEGTLAEGDGLVDIDIYDGNERTAASCLYDPDSHLTVNWHAQAPLFTNETRFEVGGRLLRVASRSTPGFEATIDHSEQWTRGVGGVVLTTLVALVVLILGRHREAALALADTMSRHHLEAKRRAEEALRENDVMQRAVDHFIVTVTDARGTIVRVNDEACRISGYSREELVGQNHRILNSRVHPPSFWKGMWRTVSQGHQWREEVCNRNKNGELYWVDSLIVPALDERGKITGYVSMRADITERKRFEVELANEKMRATEFAQQAESANRAKSAFLANMSHEIRTPMNGVLGMTELLLGLNLTPEQEDAARTIYRSADALLVILNDILDLSKIEAGRLEYERLSFDVQQLVFDVLELFRGTVAGTRVDLIVNVLPRTPRRVFGDPSRLRQVLNNLVGNAVKFTSAGHVLVELRREESTYCIAVSDTGPGIAADRQGILFEPFTQAEASTSRRHGGTGLGLAISRRLAQGMKGDITLVSKEGVGTTFTVSLPLEEDLSEPERPPLLNDVKLLVIERSPLHARALEGALRSQGASVEIANEIERLPLLLGQPWQAIVVSETLADQVLASLRGVPTHAPLVQVGPTSRLGALKAMMSGGITLPCPSHVLARGIREAMRRPVGYESGLRAVTPLPAQPEPPRGIRVLVAEDNAVNQRVARGMLEKLGCEVQMVSDGAAAVDAWLRERFDLVLMDCQMPEVDGFEATRRIRAHEAATNLPRTPVVAMTANVMNEDKEQCAACGMDDHLAKPARLGDLRVILTRWAAALAA